VAAPTETALWHANADVDVDAGDHTLFWKKAVTSGNTARLSIVNDPAGMDEGIGNGPHHWIESPRIGSTYESAVPR
jgi:hypothetical protein